MKRAVFIRNTGAAVASLLLAPLGRGTAPASSQDLPPLLIDSSGRPINKIRGWEKKRKSIKKVWAEYLGMIDTNPAAPAIKVLDEETPEGLIRQYIEYEGEPGIRVKAYLLKPLKKDGKLPAAVALHSTGDNQMKNIAGVEQVGLGSLGYNLAKKGIIVICPMCFLWHEKGTKTYEQQVDLFHDRHPKSKGMAKMLFDAMRSVDVLENTGTAWGNPSSQPILSTSSEKPSQKSCFSKSGPRRSPLPSCRRRSRTWRR